MSADHEFADYDAAYLLGSLSPEQRQDYERHLRECPACAAGVRELAGIPGLLATVRLEDALATASTGPAARPSLLPDTLALARRERRRSRRVLVAVGSAAACLAIALGGVLAAESGGQTGGSALAASGGVPMAAVVPGPMHVNAALTDVAWGTRIDLHCSYDGDGGEYPVTYTLAVTDRAGGTQRVASWRRVSGDVSTVTASTALSRSDIGQLRVLAPNGKPILTLRP